MTEWHPIDTIPPNQPVLGWDGYHYEIIERVEDMNPEWHLRSLSDYGPTFATHWSWLPDPPK